MSPRHKNRELRRKSFHIAGIILLPISLWNAALVPWLLLLMCLVYWGMEALRASGNPLPVIQNVINSCKRGDREDHIDPGPFLLAAGVGLPFLFFSVPAAQIGLIQVTLADAAASLVPHYLPSSWKLPHAGNKSWTGSLSFFAVAFVGTLFFVGWWQALIIAAVGTVLESFPPPHIDNLTVPLGVALFVSLMGWA